MKLKTIQVRAARALATWTQKDLSEESGVPLVVISNFERASGNLNPNETAKIVSAFDRIGINMWESDESIHVTMKKIEKKTKVALNQHHLELL